MYRRVSGFLEDKRNDAQRRMAADEVRFAEDDVNGVKSAEKAWIQYRDLHCKAVAQFQTGGGSMKPMMSAICLEQTTRDRIDELKRAYESSDLKLE